MDSNVLPTGIRFDQSHQSCSVDYVSLASDLFTSLLLRRITHVVHMVNPFPMLFLIETISLADASSGFDRPYIEYHRPRIW